MLEFHRSLSSGVGVDGTDFVGWLELVVLSLLLVLLLPLGSLGQAEIPALFRIG